ncbi:MAG: AbrB/MazE/SpoVT family DNA-binding domain-containing protein [Wenzhouxiangellaceae bacterium]
MDTVKIGKKGQVTIPRRVLEAAGVAAETRLIVEPEADGSIRLRPAAVYPIEIYSDQRVSEFESENRVNDDLVKRAARVIDRQ